MPFRGPDANGRNFPEQLADRARKTARRLDLALSDTDIDAIVIDAVMLANRDVMSFSTPDPGNFLSTT